MSWQRPIDLVSDEEADEMRAALRERRLTLPVLLRKWVARLLADRDERARRERDSPSTE